MVLRKQWTGKDARRLLGWGGEGVGEERLRSSLYVGGGWQSDILDDLCWGSLRILMLRDGGMFHFGWEEQEGVGKKVGIIYLENLEVGERSEFVDFWNVDCEFDG